jgi:O-antigen ligase
MRNFRFDSVIFTLLCIILLWAPIPLGSHRPWAWSLLELMIGVTYLLHLAHCWQVNGPALWQRWAWPVLIPVALLQCYLLLQISGLLPGVDTADAKQTEIMLIKGLFFWMWLQLLVTYLNNNQRLKMLVLMIVLAGFMQAFYGAVLNLSDVTHSPLFNVNEGGRARGSFAYQNHFANYLSVCLALAIGLLIAQLSSQKTQWQLKLVFRDTVNSLLSSKMLLRLAIVVMVIGLVLSRSRMGNAAFFAALGLIAGYSLFFYKRPPALLKPLIISVLLLDMFIIGSMFGLEKLQQRYEETSFASEARDNVVFDSLPLLQQHGLTGTGGGTFYTVFPAVQPAPYSGFYDHAHNEYLQFAIELGIPITAMLGLMLLWCLWQNLQVMRLSDDKLHRGLAFGGAMAIVHMLIHNSVDFNLQAPATALLFLTVLALTQCLYQRRHQKIRRSNEAKLA